MIANDQKIHLRHRISARVLVSSAKAMALFHLALLLPSSDATADTVARLFWIAQRMNVMKCLHHVLAWRRMSMEHKNAMRDGLQTAIEQLRERMEDSESLVKPKTFVFDTRGLQHVKKFAPDKREKMLPLNVKSAIKARFEELGNNPLSPILKDGARIIYYVAELVGLDLGLDKKRIISRSVADEMHAYFTMLAAQTCEGAVIVAMCHSSSISEEGLSTVTEAFMRWFSVIVTRCINEQLCNKTAAQVDGVLKTLLKSIETRLTKSINGIYARLIEPASDTDTETMTAGKLSTRPGEALHALERLMELLETDMCSNVFSDLEDLIKRIVEAMGAKVPEASAILPRIRLGH